MSKLKIIPNYEMFYNEDSLYGIYKFITTTPIDNPSDTLKNLDGETLYSSTITGQMQRLTLGLEYNAEIKPVFNKRYNQWQYESVNILPDKPNSLATQQKFLKTVVTEKQAESLLSNYPNIIDMIINDEQVDLTNVKGIKEPTFDKIKEKVIENYVLSDLLVMLQPLGITLGMIKKLQSNTTNTVVLKKKLNDNPYMLTEIRGLGFKKVDKLALSLKPQLKQSLFRTKAYVKYKLNEIGDSEGHSKIPLMSLDSYVKSDINCCYKIYQELIESELVSPTLLHIDTDTNMVGLLSNFKTEKNILDKLNQLNNAKSIVNTKLLDFEKAFSLFKQERGYELVDEQKQAVMSLRDNNVVIMTGNAGSGKSSVIDAVVKVFKGCKIKQSALSAKASQRIIETTGLEATTIHRLLGFSGEGFEYNEDNPIKADIVIIDEASMINGSIFLSLLQAIRLGCKVLLVFDDAQLPPIGCGNIATDLLKSHFSVNKLTKVHRQAEASGILMDANIVRKGINPIKQFKTNLINGELQDMYYMFRNDRDDIFNLTIKYFMKSLEKLSLDDVCICVPRKANSQISTLEFNNKIQELLLGKETFFLKRGKQMFKKGDKIIQKVNNYEKKVVNGEVGYITYINMQDKTFKAKFGDKLIEYTNSDLEQIELAYALTIHSCQGSQYNTVIVPLAMDSYILLSKELVYTAITRASKRCLVIAEPKAFDLGCKKKASKRDTWLELLLSKTN